MEVESTLKLFLELGLDKIDVTLYSKKLVLGSEFCVGSGGTSGVASHAARHLSPVSPGSGWNEAF